MGGRRPVAVRFLRLLMALGTTQGGRRRPGFIWEMSPEKGWLSIPGLLRFAAGRPPGGELAGQIRLPSTDYLSRCNTARCLSLKPRRYHSGNSRE